MTIWSNVFAIARSTYSKETCVSFQSVSRSWSDTKKLCEILQRKKSVSNVSGRSFRKVFLAPLLSAVIPAIPSLLTVFLDDKVERIENYAGLTRTIWPAWRKATPSKHRSSRSCQILFYNAYYSTRTLLTRCCTMYYCNEHKLSALHLGDRSKTQHSTLRQQFITEKISGSVLKQGSRTHSVLRQRSSQFQNHQVARCSSRAEKACGWDGGHPG